MSDSSSSQHFPIPPQPAEPEGSDSHIVRAESDERPDDSTGSHIGPGYGERPTVISHSPSDGDSSKGSSVDSPSGAPEVTRTLTGEHLDHFELLEYVGGGGMGAVYRARDTLLNRIVAVKILARNRGDDDEMRRRFRNEAQSAARLDHENIARVYYVGEDKGVHYIAFEFIEGTDIRALVAQRGVLPLAEALSYTHQVAYALAHASSRNVVHRDIKPSNIIITESGRAKLVDMGLARLHQVDPTAEDLTMSGMTLGTFDYLSPEQARDPRSADVRSDIYSLGCTLYFMLTGRPPFPEGTVLQKLLQHNSDVPPDPREFDATLPEEVSTLLQRMLAKDPRSRFQTAEELIHELDALCERVGLEFAATSRLAWDESAPSELPLLVHHLPWIVPLVLLVISVAVIDLVSSSGVDSQARLLTTPRTPPAAPEESSGNTTSDDAAATEPVPSDLEGVPPEEVLAPPVPSTEPDAVDESSEPEVPPTERVAEGAGSPAGAAGSSAASSATLARSEAIVPDPASVEPRAVVDVIRAADGTVETYSSLQAACFGARDGDEIELNYNGRVLPEKPFSVKRQITIRAGMDEQGNTYEPVIVFAPRDDNPAAARSMISVSGGELTLHNLALELIVPSPLEVPVDHWTLFELQLAERVALKKCSLTIHNATEAGDAFHQRVSFFDILAPLGRDSVMMMDNSLPAEEPIDLDLTNCVARGEAVFLHAGESQPFRCLWNNGLLATSECLLRATGTMYEAGRAAYIDVELDHVTALVRHGLYWATCAFDKPYLLPVDFQASDCIFAGRSETTFVEQKGDEAIGTFESQLGWSNRGKNYFDGFNDNAFWKIGDPMSDYGERNVAQWQNFWEYRDDRLERAYWSNPLVLERPTNGLVPDDFRLRTDADEFYNPAYHGANDRSNAGFDATLLPSLREESTPFSPAAVENTDFD